MKRYAVIGASSGTGLVLVHQLAGEQNAVRAISRRPPDAGPLIEPFAADVTDAQSLAQALDGEFDAVFYTVDIHGLFKTREEIRAVMFEGCRNAIRAVAKNAVGPKFVLLSVIGAHRPSWMWWILNMSKPGMQRNILEREQVLKESGLSYIICRAPKLNDGPGGLVTVAATPAQHELDMKRGIPRADLARALILAAVRAPVNTIWDVFCDAAGPTPDWLQTA
ncbi:MAG TPA: NAD(P)H-binding protein [Bryobacteraceae bacterium]|nr:NAD(P)H-binding protein [Bryobacteraceae bacterium]